MGTLNGRFQDVQKLDGCDIVLNDVTACNIPYGSMVLCEPEWIAVHGLERFIDLGSQAYAAARKPLVVAPHGPKQWPTGHFRSVKESLHLLSLFAAAIEQNRFGSHALAHG